MMEDYFREQILKAYKERVYTELGYHKEILLPEEEILLDISAKTMVFYQREIKAVQDQLKAELNERINSKDMLNDLIEENEELKKEIKMRKNDYFN